MPSPEALALYAQHEPHRFACEARHVAALPSDQARADYLQGVAKHRGEDAAKKLRLAAWDAMREQTNRG